MVVYWKQPEPTPTELDGLLDTYTKAGATSSDVHVEGATRARGVKYAIHAPQPDAVGQAVAISRPPWVIVVIVHARTGSPYEHRVSEVVESFRLR